VTRLAAACGLAFMLVGCGPVASSPAGTGASEAAERYFAALVGRDWANAYGCLNDATKAKFPSDSFRAKAAVFRADWGLEPEAVQVRSCDEHGTEAVAHVVLSGKGKDGHKQWKDVVALRKGPDGWKVILPANFGKVRTGH
jgi:hypothetical protein